MSLTEGVQVDVVGTKHVGDYRVRVRFSDDHTRVVDFESFLRSAGNPQTRAYLDMDKFSTFEIRNGNIVWGDYDMCFSIEDLYDGFQAGSYPLANSDARAVAERGPKYPQSKRRV